MIQNVIMVVKAILSDVLSPMSRDLSVIIELLVRAVLADQELLEDESFIHKRFHDIVTHVFDQYSYHFDQKKYGIALRWRESYMFKKESKAPKSVYGGFWVQDPSNASNDFMLDSFDSCILVCAMSSAKESYKSKSFVNKLNQKIKTDLVSEQKIRDSLRLETQIIQKHKRLYELCGEDVGSDDFSDEDEYDRVILDLKERNASMDFVDSNEKDARGRCQDQDHDCREG